ncbi:hypothetical protein SDC9_93287 [bioreactor metagenome]|uniref:Uncharacterized protein n=1 Tax=bioreactor metagenome TaxID=1076179 RepID=A0A645A6U4_9ZZZZ
MSGDVRSLRQIPITQTGGIGENSIVIGIHQLHRQGNIVQNLPPQRDIFVQFPVALLQLIGQLEQIARIVEQRNVRFGKFPRFVKIDHGHSPERPIHPDAATQVRPEIHAPGDSIIKFRRDLQNIFDHDVFLVQQPLRPWLTGDIVILPEWTKHPPPRLPVKQRPDRSAIVAIAHNGTAFGFQHGSDRPQYFVDRTPEISCQGNSLQQNIGCLLIFNKTVLFGDQFLLPLFQLPAAGRVGRHADQDTVPVVAGDHGLVGDDIHLAAIRQRQHFIDLKPGAVLDHPEIVLAVFARHFRSE